MKSEGDLLFPLLLLPLLLLPFAAIAVALQSPTTPKPATY
jgi:hypothetical protein